MAKRIKLGPWPVYVGLSTDSMQSQAAHDLIRCDFSRYPRTYEWCIYMPISHTFGIWCCRNEPASTVVISQWLEIWFKWKMRSVRLRKMEWNLPSIWLRSQLLTKVSESSSLKIFVLADQSVICPTWLRRWLERQTPQRWTWLSDVYDPWRSTPFDWVQDQVSRESTGSNVSRNDENRWARSWKVTTQSGVSPSLASFLKSLIMCRWYHVVIDCDPDNWSGNIRW